MAISTAYAYAFHPPIAPSFTTSPHVSYSQYSYAAIPKSFPNCNTSPETHHVLMTARPSTAAPSITPVTDYKPNRAHDLNSSKIRTVDVYDTTLRDGAQGEGISLSVRDKIAIAERLGEFGVAYIEGGWPGSNPKDMEFFREWRRGGFSTGLAKMVAFGATRYKGKRVEDDAQVAKLVEAGTPVITLVGKAWDVQVGLVLETTLEENLRMIEDTVEYLKGKGKEVMLDAEHFFDGHEGNREYAMKCLKVAVDAGVDVLVLCDTNGGQTPWQIAKTVSKVAAEFPETRVGIHCHNDMDLAVANSISAIREGASLLQGTLNGYGERTGNANLTSIIPVLQLKMGFRCVGEGIRQLTNLSRYADEIANQSHDSSRPFVGDSAFAHKGGLHVAAVVKDANTYQHIDPAMIGNKQRILISELSGRGNIITKAKELGLYHEKEGKARAAEENQAWKNRAKQILERVKRLENRGYTFEGAEASVELMIRRSMPSYKCPFELVDFTVITGNRRSEYDTGQRVNKDVTQATVKLNLIGGGLGGERPEVKTCLEVGEGNGPVDAVHEALSKTLMKEFARLQKVSLSDYKVRILDNESATRAITRVMVVFKDSESQQIWTTVSVHRNIIVASVGALMDGFEYAMTRFLPQCVETHPSRDGT